MAGWNLVLVFAATCSEMALRSVLLFHRTVGVADYSSMLIRIGKQNVEIE